VKLSNERCDLGYDPFSYLSYLFVGGRFAAAPANKPMTDVLHPQETDEHGLVPADQTTYHWDPFGVPRRESSAGNDGGVTAAGGWMLL
jgi:hypothetical protein